MFSSFFSKGIASHSFNTYRFESVVSLWLSDSHAKTLCGTCAAETMAVVSEHASESSWKRNDWTSDCAKQCAKVKRKNAIVVFVSVIRQYWKIPKWYQWIGLNVVDESYVYAPHS